MDCRAELKNGMLILENSEIKREISWNDGALSTKRITNKKNGYVFEMDGTRPDFILPNEVAPVTEAGFEAKEKPATAIRAACFETTLTFRLKDLHIKRVFRLFPDTPVIVTETHLKGRTQAKSWIKREKADFVYLNAEDIPPAPVLERVEYGSSLMRCKAVCFFDVTDARDNLVSVREFNSFCNHTPADGNLLFVNQMNTDNGLFILRESPCSDIQLHPAGWDFAAGHGEIIITGLGIEPVDLKEDEWTAGTTVVLGVCSILPGAASSALRRYQKAKRVLRSGRDHMIMLNTWGDRGGASRVTESFIRAELEAGARLGVTHFQIDDGWQAGNFSSGDKIKGRRSGGFWDIDSAKFPKGLASVSALAREKGIELALWFAPESADSYADWQDNAKTLIKLHKEYGIRTFKIDAMDVADKKAEENITALFDAVLKATNGAVFFNLDVTAGKRFGYHCRTEYGNLFLENRYTDWANFYPHSALRNLWQLSGYVPPELLQVEFLNINRNREKYSPGDLLAPGKVRFEYGFAITMMAQPLAWFEASGLSKEDFALAPVIKAYRAHQEKVHSGVILPVGVEPSGSSWTGFQSILTPETGYLLIFREQLAPESGNISLHAPKNAHVKLKVICGEPLSEVQELQNGGLTFKFNRPAAYSLVQYTFV